MLIRQRPAHRAPRQTLVITMISIRTWPTALHRVRMEQPAVLRRLSPRSPVAPLHTRPLLILRRVRSGPVMVPPYRQERISIGGGLLKVTHQRTAYVASRS